MGALELLIEAAIDLGEVDQAMADSYEIQRAVMERAEEARQFWIDYWEAFDHPWSREHTLRSGYVVRPGDYSESIKVKFGRTPDGLPKATVGTRDFRARWIEYGSSHMPEFAPRATTVARFGGSGNAISS